MAKKISEKNQALLALGAAAAIGIFLHSRKKSKIGEIGEYNPKKEFFKIISKKINLDWYDSIMVFEQGNRIVVVVAQRENRGGTAYYFNQKDIMINSQTLYKRDIIPTDVTTNGFVWIYEYFKK